MTVQGTALFLAVTLLATVAVAQGEPSASDFGIVKGLSTGGTVLGTAVGGTLGDFSGLRPSRPLRDGERYKVMRGGETFYYVPDRANPNDSDVIVAIPVMAPAASTGVGATGMTAISEQTQLLRKLADKVDLLEARLIKLEKVRK